MGLRKADRLAEQVQRQVRNRVLQALARRELAIDGVYKRAAEEIRRKLRAIGYSNDEVARVVQDALEGAAADTLPLVEEQLREAAQAGNSAAQRTYQTIFGEGSTAESPFASRSVSGPTRKREE